MGVWIEIPNDEGQVWFDSVTPLVGVWIEITVSKSVHRVCGVTPLVGVWIEISSMFSTEDITMRHSPCGSVD